MQAIGNEVMEKFPDKTVLYLPTTKFIDEVVKAIRKNNM
jgi:chromosomal replication initiation ATPase DnaA